MRLRTLVAFLFPVLISLPSAATTVLKVPLEQMARDADLVVRGTVAGVASGRGSRDPAALETRVTIRVKSVLKGHATAPSLTVHLPGGTDGKRTVRIPGMPGFRNGEEVVLFLEQVPGGWIPAGLSEGKFSVTPDGSGRLRARRAASDAFRLTRDAAGRLVEHEGMAPDDDLDLEDLVLTVRRVTGGAR